MKQVKLRLITTSRAKKYLVKLGGWGGWSGWGGWGALVKKLTVTPKKEKKTTTTTTLVKLDQPCPAGKKLLYLL